MLPRPRVRMPLWIAFAIAGAAYLARSIMRGFDFRPDLPMDAVLLGLLVLVVAMVAWLRADDARRDAAEGEPFDDEAEGGTDPKDAPR